MLKEDVGRLTSNMIAFTDSGDDRLWEPVEEDLRRRASQGVRITFVVSEHEFSLATNKVLRKLAQEPNITLFQVSIRPPVDLRLIDGKHLHIAYHGSGQNNNRPCWRTGPGGALPEQIRDSKAFIGEYLDQLQLI
ncbi:MAG: hypothetical protein HYV76_02220 [Candidatus Vogelbacteria bacterium]|nr:hypothetical protein [Candidatus Vogelbacteria bacterium]